MATAEYVTPAELQAELKELDKEQASRLYTVKGELLLRMDQVQSSLEGRIDGLESAIQGLTLELSNGHK